MLKKVCCSLLVNVSIHKLIVQLYQCHKYSLICNGNALKSDVYIQKCHKTYLSMHDYLCYFFYRPLCKNTDPGALLGLKRVIIIHVQ